MIAQSGDRIVGFFIIFWNLRLVNARIFYLYSLINDINPQVICLNEIMLDPGDALSVRGNNSTFHARNQHGGGSTILVRDNVYCQTAWRFLPLPCKCRVIVP